MTVGSGAEAKEPKRQRLDTVCETHLGITFLLDRHTNYTSSVAVIRCRC